MKQLFFVAILTAIAALLSTSASAESNEVFFKDCGYRCKPYESCKVGKDKMACYYGSGGCCSGGLTFKNGKDFSIEWIMEYFDQEGRPISEPKEGYFAMVNDKKVKFKMGSHMKVAASLSMSQKRVISSLLMVSARPLKSA